LQADSILLATGKSLSSQALTELTLNQLEPESAFAINKVPGQLQHPGTGIIFAIINKVPGKPAQSSMQSDQALHCRLTNF
jgi:hypothetical protein